MAKAKINKKSVDALTIGETLFDTDLRGFMVRARGSSKSFAVKYSVAGRQRIFTLGRYGDLTPDQARSAAQDALNRANKARHDKSARDPQSQKEEERVAPKNLVGEICTEFVVRYAKKNRSWKETERILNRHIVPLWGRRAIQDVRRSEVVALLDAIEDESGAAMATAVLAQVRKMFNWHATRDDTFAPPIVPGTARTKPKKMARSRTLSDEEIRVMWRALDIAQPPFRQLVRFLLLSAQRRSEAALSKNTELGDNTGVWAIPAERYKTNVEHLVPLSPMAAQQWREARASDPVTHDAQRGPYVFSTQSGQTPFSGFSKSKNRLDVRMEVLLRDKMTDEQSRSTPEPVLRPWRLHDLRRTAKTLMQRAGVRPNISERVLGHVIAGVEGTYDRYQYLPERRQALDSLAGEIRHVLADLSAEFRLLKLAPSSTAQDDVYPFEAAAMAGWHKRT